MADKVYPSGKATTTNSKFPATKSQLYGQTRPTYRFPAPPTTNESKHRRGCCCSCCLWITVALLVFLLLIAVSGAVFYVLYRPHRPTFTLSSLKISTLNFSSPQVLTTNVKLNISTRNPNKKLTFIYDPFAVSLLTTSEGVVLGTGSVLGFAHEPKNTTLLDVTVTSNGQALDDTSAGNLKADLKSKNGVGLKVKIDTKVKVKLGGLKLPKVGIRVSCDGIKGSVPSGKTATSASVGNSKCEVDLRFKIWKWTF